ncbi:MAG: alginate lyase family protein [Halanaerobiaceae bacterium]
MNFYKKYNIKINFDEQNLIKKAEKSYNTKPIHITDFESYLSEGRKHDYFSMGDYWWPDPEQPDGLPYIHKDGKTNPDNFNKHRLLLRNLRTNVVNLTAGYLLNNNEKYVEKACQFLKEFFLDEETKMNPHLRYAQAIPGRCSGRGIGIIDTLHLIGIPVAIDILKENKKFSSEVYQGLLAWFSKYLDWMTSHEYGKKEMKMSNNHGVCWCVQVAIFAKFTGNQKYINFCKKRYKEVILPEQMDKDGSFPRELDRTKPYGYSIFILDNMINLCYILSTPEDNLWNYKLKDGRGIKKGIEFLYPYLKNKDKWPYSPDVQHFENWPVRIASLLFATTAFDEKKYLDLWYNLPKDPDDMEIKRNVAIRQPINWLKCN